MKKDITLVMYSHSSYSDVWPVFFKQADKYLGQYKKALFSDDDLGKTPKDWDFFKYDDSKTYAERMHSCLIQLDTPLSFLHHEDMPLYDSPDYALLDLYERIVKNEDIDFVRLLRSVDVPLFNFKDVKTLYEVPSYSNFLFATQPSIFKTKSLAKIYGQTKIETIGDFEINAQSVCRENNIKGLFHYGGEPKRGAFHYDSNAYPYICTAVVKGKWNLTEYDEELKNLLKESNVDYKLRGAI